MVTGSQSGKEGGNGGCQAGVKWGAWTKCGRGRGSGGGGGGEVESNGLCWYMGEGMLS